MNAFKYGYRIWGNELARIHKDFKERGFECYDFLGLDATQTKEIKKSIKDEDWFHVALEFADKILVADYAIKILGFDTNALLLYRLASRHQGRTREITSKYDEILGRERPIKKKTKGRKKK